MPGHPDSTKLSKLLLSNTHTGHTHMMTGFVSFGEENCTRWILTFKSQNETHSPCEGMQTLQGKTDMGMSPCCGRPSDTGNWKPRLEGSVWIFFPKIYGVAQLALLLVLERQPSSHSALSQRSPLAMEISEDRQNTNNVPEAYFV